MLGARAFNGCRRIIDASTYMIEEYASIIEADEDSTLLLGLAILVEQDRNHQTTNVARGSRDK